MRGVTSPCKYGQLYLADDENGKPALVGKVHLDVIPDFGNYLFPFIICRNVVVHSVVFQPVH